MNLQTEGYHRIRDENTIDHHHLDDIDTALSHLETSFGRMRAALLRERNSSIPAVRLPSELLSEIFSYGKIHATLLATRVCHRWRVAALNHAPLWSTLNMVNKRNSHDILAAQLERAGSHPLNVTFDLLEGPGGVRSLSMLSVESTTIIERASSIANLSTQTLPPLWSPSLPLLKSLHLCVDQSTRVETFSLKPCNLRHLSIDFYRIRLPIPPPMVRILWTLHLKRTNEPALYILRVVVGIPTLRELVLDVCGSRDEAFPEEVDAIVQNRAPSSLKLVKLHHVSSPFLVCFLRPGIITSSTNLQIEPRPHIEFYRDLPTTAGWIDFENQYFLFQHGSAADSGCLTRVALGNVDRFPLIDRAISSVPRDSIERLFWTGASISDRSLECCPSLVVLAFEFYVAAAGKPKDRLTDVVNDELASSCPHLKYLGITIRRPKAGGILQRDDAEEAIDAFLEAWINSYGETFSIVEICDEYRPKRWMDKLDVLRMCADTFEIRKESVLNRFKPPTFPTPRQFVVQEKEEDLVSGAQPFRGFAQTFW